MLKYKWIKNERKKKDIQCRVQSKLILEVLEGEKIINEIASSYEIIPNNWKKQFLENMSLAFDKSSVVKQYKEEIEVLQKSNDNLAKKLVT